MEIDIAAKSETEIYYSIENRFSANITYPFSNQLRFSMVVGKRFLFIRDTQLEIYSNSGYEKVLNISMSNLKDVIERYFGYNIKPIESQLINTN